MVVGDDVEEGDDLVDVVIDPSPGVALGDLVLERVLPNGVGDRGIDQQLRPNICATGEPRRASL
jgi:hypothetical protein